MTVLLIVAIVAALIVAVALATGPFPARRVPPARPRREDPIQAINGVGDDADRIYR